MPYWLKTGIGLVALISWVVLMGVSLAANATFAATLGSTDSEKTILAWAAVASDLFKSISPIAFLYFVSQRRWWPVLATACIFIITGMFSLIAATGFVSSERFGAYDRQASEMRRSERAAARVKKAEDDVKWIPDGGRVSSAIIASQLEGLQNDKIFLATDGCKASSTARANEKWCRDYRQLSTSLVAAQQREKTENMVTELNSVRDKTTRQSEDYQVEVITRILSTFGTFDARTVLVALTAMTVLLIEFGSAFGLTVAVNLLIPERLRSDLLRANGRVPLAPVSSRNVPSRVTPSMSPPVSVARGAPLPSIKARPLPDDSSPPLRVVPITRAGG
jgi:hypothetical protein